MVPPVYSVYGSPCIESVRKVAYTVTALESPAWRDFDPVVPPPPYILQVHIIFFYSYLFFVNPTFFRNRNLSLLLFSSKTTYF